MGYLKLVSRYNLPKWAYHNCSFVGQLIICLMTCSSKGHQMRILYYNWVQFDDVEKRGGGVTVYQYNLIDAIKDLAEVFFLSSGISYSFDSKPRIVRTKNCFGDKCNSFELINSPILSPAINAYRTIRQYLEDETILNLFVDFLNEYGPFDVVHFNNIEGLSINVLRFKEIFPDIKVFFSIHNYYLFCPQVNLWQDEKLNCQCNNDYQKCCSCVPDSPPVGLAKKRHILAYYLKKWHIMPGSFLFRSLFFILPRMVGLYKKIKRRVLNQEEGKAFLENNGHEYKTFVEKNIEYVNKYVDTVLAVSERVREIAISHGLDKDKIITNYIGTKAAETQYGRCASDISSDVMKIAFFGYARRDKGFFFLLDALEQLPEKYTKTIDVLLCVGVKDPKIISDINNLKNRYHSVTFKNGYAHSEMESLLIGTHLGIIPVLWEDNLPQVAIEMVSCGVPILTSNLGGAKEIGRNNYFVFEAGNIDDFIDHLKELFDNRPLLESFWHTSMNLVNMSEHICKLVELYNQCV